MLGRRRGMSLLCVKARGPSLGVHFEVDQHLKSSHAETSGQNLCRRPRRLSCLRDQQAKDDLELVSWAGMAAG